MGLKDYESLSCGMCESDNVGMLPLAVFNLDGPQTMFPMAYCRDCGTVIVPAEEEIANKIKEWGEAIRSSVKQEKAKKKKRVEPKSKLKKKVPKKEKPKCEKCQKEMEVDNTSGARYTLFILWKCKCGHTWLEKRHVRDEEFEDSGPLDPEDIPEVGGEDARMEE